MLLESHLRYLADALDAARPDDAAKWRRLRVLAAELYADRVAILPDAELDRLGAEFDAAVGAQERALLPNTGRLLAAAVADEAAGRARAVTSVLGWIADSGRFSPRWLAAVDATVAAARAAVAAAAGA